MISAFVSTVMLISMVVGEIGVSVFADHFASSTALPATGDAMYAGTVVIEPERPVGGLDDDALIRLAAGYDPVMTRAEIE